MLKDLTFYVVLFVLILADSCQFNNRNTDQKQDSSAAAVTSTFCSLESPLNASSFKTGDVVPFRIKIRDSIQKIDSIRLLNNGKVTGFSTNSSFDWTSENSKVGQIWVKLEIYLRNQKPEYYGIVLNILSDIVPVQYDYKIINVYPHDKEAYTQGLQYEDGILYESTGLYRQSTLRKEKLKTGEIINSIKLDDKIFAEGMVKVQNKIYQITYREQVGFVYDASTFKVLQKFNLPLREGWGMTYDGKHLLISDGSSNVYFFDKDNFTLTEQIQIASNTDIYESINKMEYIQGKVYANVYTKDIVLIFDPQTGKVTGIVDFKGLLPEADHTENTDVLNGIAYIPANKHLLVTGKNWPKLFEVELIKK